MKGTRNSRFKDRRPLIDFLVKGAKVNAVYSAELLKERQAIVEKRRGKLSKDFF